jgi:hypothetical protein
MYIVVYDAWAKGSDTDRYNRTKVKMRKEVGYVKTSWEIVNDDTV